MQGERPLARAATPLLIRSISLITCHDELKIGRRLYLVNFVLLACMGLTLCLCLVASRFMLKVEATKAVLTVPVLAVAGLSLLSIKREWGARLGFVLLAVGQFGFISMFGAPLTYVAAAANLQLQDAKLAYYDHLLGLDWPAYFSFATSHPLLLDYASAAYFAIWLPGVGVPLVLGLWGQFLRLQQFVMATILTLCAVMLVSALVPAFGTYYQYSLPADTDLFKAYGYLTQMKDLPMVRNGSLRLLQLQHLGGIITFPSFHAAAAILAIWGFWGIWWMRPPALITNVAMLLATPLVGGHYFVDVIAGVAVALLAIEATKAMSALLRDRSGRKAGDQLWDPSVSRSVGRKRERRPPSSSQTNTA